MRKILLAFGIASLTLSALALADGIELTAQGLSVSDDSVTTTYDGDVMLRVPKGMPLETHADKTDSGAGGEQTLKGHVRFKVAGLLITTEEAKLTHAANGDTVINMDTAESRVAK